MNPLKTSFLARQDEQVKQAMCEKSKRAPRFKIVRTIVAGMLVFSMVPMVLSGCSAGSTSNSTTTTTANTEATSDSSSSSLTDLSKYDLEYTDRDCDASYDEKSAVNVALEGTSATVTAAEGVDKTGVSVSNGTVTISKEGVYILSGTLSDGQIVVSCNEDEKAKVQIVLNGVNITSSTGSAIYVEEAKKVFLTLANGSTNTLTDAASYTAGQDDGSANAAIYSKDNLTLQGSGSLTVTGNYADGIACKDTLVVTGGTYNIAAKDDALRGKDGVKIKDGTFNITAGGDAVKSTNADEEGRGFVAIDGGTFSVSAGDDAYHAETLMLVNGGTINVSTCYEGLEGSVVIVNGGTTHIVATDDGVNAAAAGGTDAQANDFGGAGMNHKQNMQDSGAMGGQATNGSTDGATMTPPSGDATGNVPSMPDGQTPSGSTDGTAPTQPSGSTDGSVPSMPDGQTPGAASSNGSSTDGGNAAAQGFTGMGGGTGGGMMDGDSSCLVQINGGYLYVDAAGDGLDSNGSLEITGGVVLVSGPTSGADASMDYGLNATISGGTIIAVGSQQMAENFTSGTQAFALVSANGTAGQNVAVTDASGKVLASFTASKQFQCAIVSTPGMTSGTSYNLVVGGTVTGANADGYASSGTVSGGTTTSFTAEAEDSSTGFGAGMPQGLQGGGRGGSDQNGQGTQSGRGGKQMSAGSGQTASA